MLTNERTDWTAYYAEEKIPAFILKAVGRHIRRNLSKFVDCSRPITIAELGGANTVFYDLLKSAIPIAGYHVLDNNSYGLARSRARYPDDPALHTHLIDVLDDSAYRLALNVDLVMSFGLVEHFAPADTRKCIASHFALAKPGGTVLISFPTPTLVYRAVRGLMERARRWDFPDERPLMMPEIEPILAEHGSVLRHHRIWSTLVTQLMTVTRVGL